MRLRLLILCIPLFTGFTQLIQRRRFRARRPLAHNEGLLILRIQRQKVPPNTLFLLILHIFRQRRFRVGELREGLRILWRRGEHRRQLRRAIGRPLAELIWTASWRGCGHLLIRLARVCRFLVRDRGRKVSLLRNWRLLLGHRETFGAAWLLDLVIRAPTWSSLPYKVSQYSHNSLPCGISTRARFNCDDFGAGAGMLMVDAVQQCAKWPALRSPNDS